MDLAESLFLSQVLVGVCMFVCVYVFEGMAVVLLLLLRFLNFPGILQRFFVYRIDSCGFCFSSLAHYEQECMSRP